jgi:small subunit ribosomal protein S19
MARSLKKGPFVDPNILKKINKLKPGGKEVIKTWSRGTTITPEMIGFVFGVYNGKEFISVEITEEMVGYRLGEFSPTTKFARHGGRMQREIEQVVAEKEAAKLEQAKAPEVKAPGEKK